MGTVVFRLEGDDASAVNAFLKLSDAERKAAMEAKKLEMATERASRRALAVGDAGTHIDKAFAGAARSVASMAAGFASFGSFIGLFRQYDQHLANIRNKQVELGEGGLALQGQMLSLAEQEGRGGRAGLMQATRNAFRTAQVGSTSIETAGTIRNAVQSFFKFAPAETQESIAGLVTQAIGKTGGTAEEGAALAQLLKNAGVKTPQQAREAMAKINQSLTDHPEMGAGRLAIGTLKGGMAMGTLGGSLEDMLAYSAQGRMVTGTFDEGAELTRQILQNTLGQEDALKIVQKQLKLPTLDAAREQPANVVMKAMGEAIEQAFASGGPAAASRLLKDVEGRTRIQLLRFYSPSAVETGRQVRAGLERADVGAMDAQYAAAATTDVAAAQRAENERRMRRAEQSHRRFNQVELRKEAQARLEEYRAAGRIGFLNETLLTDEDLLQGVQAGIEAEDLGLITEFRPEDSASFGDLPMEPSPLRTMVDDAKRRRAAAAGAVPTSQPAAGGPGAGAVPTSQPAATQPAPGPQASIQYHYGDVYNLGQRSGVAGNHPFELGVM